MIDSIFYAFGHNSFHTRGFTWATSIYPTSDLVDRRCPACNAVEYYPVGSFDVRLEGGSKYPDVLGCGAYPFLILSENVIGAFQENNISRYHTYPIGIRELKSKKLERVEPPIYYRVEIDGKFQIDMKASGLRVIRNCPKCHAIVTDPPIANGFRVVPNSWDKSQLFRDIELYPRVNFCSERVVKLAHDYKLTNFRFELMQGPWDPSKKGIDYMNFEDK